jgi:Ca2+-transporting ATPase
MAQPPRRASEPLVSSRHIALSITQGIATTFVVTLLYWLAIRSGMAAAESRTLAFVTLVSANCALIFSSRSMAAGVGSALRRITPISYWVVAGTLIALAAVTCIPVFAEPFAFAGTSLRYWLGSMAIGVMVFLLFELAKIAVAARNI